jgi:hypothetical protein
MRFGTIRPILRGLTFAILAAIGPGCGPKDAGPDLPTQTSTSRGDPETDRAIKEGLNQIVNEAEARYKPLYYEYNEGLLQIADQAESILSGKAKPEVASLRFMPKLDEAEEREHFRESIRRWEEKNGQTFRAAIDPLIAEVAARKPGEAFHPDFQKRFGVVFDSFIPIEVQEARERRNRAIRAKAEGLLAQYRAAQPVVVKDYERMLGQQYPQTSPAPAPAR